MLLERYVELVEERCGAAFARGESQQRAIEHALSLPCTLGVRTIARTICTLGREQRRDWSAEWRRRAQPIEVGRRFRVDPREPEEVEAPVEPGGRILLRLPARTAFGPSAVRAPPARWPPAW